MPTTWLIPNWAPNVHPLVIHFPIVLVMAAAVVDLVDVAFERSVWLRAATTTLYITGALSLIVAFLTGLQAQGTVLIPGMAYPVLAEHRQWALIDVVLHRGRSAATGDAARRRRAQPEATPRAARNWPRVSRAGSADGRTRGATRLRVRHRDHRRSCAKIIG